MALAATAPLLRRLLLQRNAKSRLWTALAALCIGTALLLVAVLIWWNFRQLLNGKGDNDSLGSTFLTVSKRVTNENMGNSAATVFQPAEIEALRKVAGVEDVGLVQPIRTKVYMRMDISSGLGFSTDMLLEAVSDRFMDRLPKNWGWKEGDIDVPVIMSSSFLSLYNYGYAPFQGLPQLSEESIGAIPFKLEVGGGEGGKTYIGRIVGFSDRINSVLVPETFTSYINNRFAPEAAAAPPSRVIIKIKDPSDEGFADFMERHDYLTNSEQLRWSRLRAVVQVVATATGLLALLLMVVSVLVFVLFIELTVARAQDAVRLLLQLGYSPATLSRFMYRRFLPMILGSLGGAIVLAFAVQIAAAVISRKQGLSLSYLPGWPMWIVAAAALLVLLVQMRRGVRRALGTV